MSTDLATRMTNAPRERRWPNVTPKDAATLILIDRTRKTPKLLMGRRHEGHKFMPGKYVFPGGRIEAWDRRMVAAGALDPKVEERLMARVQRPTASRARALALAAIRETFEETGLLLGTTEHGAPEIEIEGPWGAFRAARRLSRTRAIALRRPRHHAAPPPQAFRYAVLRRGRVGDRRQGRRRRGAGIRTRRTLLGRAEGSTEA